MVCQIKTAAALVGALASVALGHFHVTGIVADGVYYGGFSLDYYYDKQNTGTFPESVGWWAEDLDNGFISPDAYNTSEIICHKNGQPANLTATVAAGGTIEFQWTTVGHPGPVLTYAALCPDDCTSPTLDKTALEWVKIDEAGYSTADQTWASDDIAANNNSWTTTVPSTLASGNYVFRHEIIAVHGAESLDGAQNYPQCLNVAVTGGGSASPVGTLGEALYSETDPGILFNPYTTITDYTIPGPALMEGGVEQTVTATNGVESAAATTTATASSTSAAAAAAATTTSSSVVVATISTVASSSVETAVAAAATSVAPSSAQSVAPAVATGASSSCKRRRHARDVVA
ncbi:unnamed protein product [Discula destructiva]